MHTDGNVTLQVSQTSTTPPDVIVSWRPPWYLKEDWITVWWGFVSFCLIVFVGIPLAKFPKILPGEWDTNPLDSWNLHTGLYFLVLNMIVIMLALPGMIPICYEKKWIKAPTGGAAPFNDILHASTFALATTILVATGALWLGEQKAVARAGLSNEAWAIIFGLLIGNILPLFCPLPTFVIMMGKSAETYVKVGLVLLGIGLESLDDLGYQGAVVAIPVTFLVLGVGFAIARQVMRPDQRKLAMLISGGTAVCGSSAATALQSTIGGTTNDLTVCIGILSVFTIVQIVATPAIALAMGFTKAVVAASLGGTINSTGAVVAAASFLNDPGAVQVASIVKVIQNTLIGVVAVLALVYWERYEKPQEWEQLEQKDSVASGGGGERWYVTFWQKFPKFVLGFLALSTTLTILRYFDKDKALETRLVLTQVSKWWFTLGFVNIGVATQLGKLYKTIVTPPISDRAFPIMEAESTFKAVMRPVGTYIIVQTLNIVVTFAVAEFMFKDFTLPTPETPPS